MTRGLALALLFLRICDLAAGAEQSTHPTMPTCDDDGMDLCYDIAPMPMSCDDPELDLCDDTPPMPMSCDDPELDLCDDTSPMPTEPGMPNEPDMPNNTNIVEVTSFDTEMEVDDVTKFDVEKFKAAMAAASDVGADNVEIAKVEYRTKVTYSMAATVTKADATTAIAKSCNVSESQVEVKINSSRRLSEFRRLATTIEATIKTQTASEVSSIGRKAADPALLQESFTAVGVSAAPIVTSQPKQAVAVTTKLKSQAGAPAPAVPPASTIESQVSAKVGITVVAKTSNVEQVQVTQTRTTTRKPTTTRTKVREEAANNANGQSPALLLACAVASAGALLLDAA